MTRYFIDTEFYEDGKTIDLISIAVVGEDGREFYAENRDFNWDLVLADHWLQENVRPYLWSQVNPHSEQMREGNRWIRDGGTGGLEQPKYIASKLLRFVRDGTPTGVPTFWAYYADYDWVALCQLFGTMMDLPRGFPMYCRDLKQLADHLGNPKMPEQEQGEHHALYDARHNLVMFQFLKRLVRHNEMNGVAIHL